MYLREESLNEIFEKIKLKNHSKKLQKLFDKLKFRAFTLPGEKKEENIVRKIRTMLKDAIKKIKSIEDKFSKKEIDKSKVKEEINKSKTKLRETIKFLKKKDVIGMLGETSSYRLAAIISSFLSLGVMGSLALVGMLKNNTEINPIKKYMIENYIIEGLKRFKYSEKLQKLISKLESKRFKFKKEYGSTTELEEAIHVLKDEILKPVKKIETDFAKKRIESCLLYTSPSPRD